MIANLGFSLAAGVLSTLSPCVLPLLPIVLGGAASAHRYGMVALTGGMVLSFAGLGMFIATAGYAIGLDNDVVRLASAVLLGVLGLAMMSGLLQQRVAVAASGLSNAGNRLMGHIAPGSANGQFLIGLVLGAVWSPCVGPTLGAASVLAAQGKDLWAAGAVMLTFGVGAALPLLLIGTLSREALQRWRGRMLNAGRAGKMLLGGAAVLTAALILTGADHWLEAALVAASPAWLTGVTTRF